MSKIGRSEITTFTWSISAPETVLEIVLNQITFVKGRIGYISARGQWVRNRTHVREITPIYFLIGMC